MIEQNENESDISGMSRQGRLNYKDEYGEPKTSEEKQLMEQYGEQYPVYNWKKNKGYPTQQHKQAIADYGITPLHRMTFNMAIQLKLDLK